MEAMLDDTSFDVILVGTGPVQSVVAAALARIGKKILHLDPNGYYGGCYGTLPLLDMLACVDPSAPQSHDVFRRDTNSAANDESSPALQPPPPSAIAIRFGATNLIHSARTHTHVPHAPPCSSPACRRSGSVGGRPCYAPSCPFVARKGSRARMPPEGAPIRTWVDVSARARMYNIDLIPKVCFSRGDTVQLLISSNIGRYLDFKVISNTFMYTGSELQEVPCSKQTLLLNKHISPKDKRLLVKFLQFCSSYDEASQEFQESKDRPFHETLDHVYKLNASLQQFILNAMAFVPRDVPTSEGLGAVRKYLASLGVYGSTPFLYSVYGAGELSQAFCRLAAVYAGVYVLRSSISHLLLSEDKSACTGVYAGGQQLSAKYVVLPSHTLTEPQPSDRSVFRGIAIIENGIPGLDSGTHVISFPQGMAGNSQPVKVFVLGAEVAATPKNQYLVQLVAEGSVGQNPEEELRPVLESLLRIRGTSSGPEPKLIWTSFFAVRSTPALLPGALSGLSGTLIPCRDVDNGELGFDELVKEAEIVFRQICPTDEYLPSAPNPEDIVWEGGEDDATPAAEPHTTACGTRFYSLDAYEEAEHGVLQLPEGTPSLREPEAPSAEAPEVKAPTQDLGAISEETSSA